MIEQAAIAIGGFVIGAALGHVIASIKSAKEIASHVSDCKEIIEFESKRLSLINSCLEHQVRELKKKLSRKHLKRGKDGRFA